MLGVIAAFFLFLFFFTQRKYQHVYNGKLMRTIISRKEGGTRRYEGKLGRGNPSRRFDDIKKERRRRFSGGEVSRGARRYFSRVRIGLFCWYDNTKRRAYFYLFGY